jgi:hypothetical protein
VTGYNTNCLNAGQGASKIWAEPEDIQGSKTKDGAHVSTSTDFVLRLNISRSQWPRSLRRRSAAERLLGSWV